jgi:hypothetical protein
VSDGTEKMARHCWSMAQRVGMQIAELAIDMRETAFAGAERCLRAAGRDLGVAGAQLDSFIDLQMRAIRQIVTDFDARERRRLDRRVSQRACKMGLEASGRTGSARPTGRGPRGTGSR